MPTVSNPTLMDRGDSEIADASEAKEADVGEGAPRDRRE